MPSLGLFSLLSCFAEEGPCWPFKPKENLTNPCCKPSCFLRASNGLPHFRDLPSNARKGAAEEGGYGVSLSFFVVPVVFPRGGCNALSIILSPSHKLAASFSPLIFLAKNVFKGILEKPPQIPVYWLSQSVSEMAQGCGSSEVSFLLLMSLGLRVFPSTQWWEGEGQLCPTSFALDWPSFSGLRPVPTGAGGVCPVLGPGASPESPARLGVQRASPHSTLEAHELFVQCPGHFQPCRPSPQVWYCSVYLC